MSLRRTEIIDWLLEGDPAVRWQVLRDLKDAPPKIYEIEKNRIAHEGWGAALLREQREDGLWGNGLYSPKWTSTTYTLLLLRRLGLNPDNTQAKLGAQSLLDGGEWVDGGIIFWKSRQIIDLCVVGLFLSIVAYFRLQDPRIDGMIEMLFAAQRTDGSWLDAVEDVADKEFHIGISVLEGLLEYRRNQTAERAEVTTMMTRGREFLANHHLYRNRKNGGIIQGAWTKLSFPPRWHYDVLRALDFFQDAGFSPDERLEDAIGLIKQKRRKDGTWTLQNKHPGRVFFDLERAGRPSRINTLRALRVLDWWDSTPRA